MSSNISDCYEVLKIPIDRIRAGKFRLRTIDESAIDGLVLSIRQCGILQPIMVTQRDDHFEVVFGNHRLEACRRLGWKEIPATVIQATDEESFLLQIVENIQRNVKVNPVEEARGFRILMNGMTIQEIASKIGKSYQYVWQRIRLLEKLHPDLLNELAKGRFRRLTASHAEQLSLVRDPARQIELANAIEDHDISVKELEEILYKELFAGNESEVQKGTLPLSVWRKSRDYFIEADRVCLVSESTFNMIVESLGKKARAVGRRAGQFRRKNFLLKAERAIPKRDWLVRCFNEVIGWGKISIEGSKVICVDSIVANSAFLTGYLEGYLAVKLEPNTIASRSHYFFTIGKEMVSPCGEAEPAEQTGTLAS